MVSLVEDGKPDCQLIGRGPVHTVFAVSRDNEPVARLQLDCLVLNLQSRHTLSNQHPLIFHLVISETSGRGMAVGDDPLDADVPGVDECLGEFVRQRGGDGGEEVVDAAKHGLLAIVRMHVPAHSNKHPDRGWHAKPEHGQRELYATLARHSGRVLALFHGHFHNGLRGWDDAASAGEMAKPIHEVCFPSSLYNQDRKLVEQQASGYNVSEFRPAYCVVTLGQGKMQVQLRVVGQGDAASKVLPVGA